MQPRRPPYRDPRYAAQRQSSLRPEPVSPQSVWFKRMTRKEFLATLGALLLGVALFVFFEHHHQAAQHPAPAAKTAQTTFDKKQFSLTDPASLWVVVNKRRPLAPLDYAPANLVNPQIPLRLNKADGEMTVRADTAAALEELSTAASRQGLHLMLASGYRSYQLQVTVYNSEVRANGQAGADQESARPGYSEHQTGLAADLEPVSRKCELETCFESTPEGVWLAANAWKYGFIIRYQKDITSITGYEYEPWHVRYIGKALAAELHRTQTLTLEQFFDLPAAPGYQ